MDQYVQRKKIVSHVCMYGNPYLFYQQNTVFDMINILAQCVMQRYILGWIGTLSQNLVKGGGVSI